jgi:hypothetical protein
MKFLTNSILILILVVVSVGKMPTFISIIGISLMPIQVLDLTCVMVIKIGLGELLLATETTPLGEVYKAPELG